MEDEKELENEDENELENEDENELENDDEEITLQALREELKELKKTNDKLNKEVKSLKVSNQRMSLKLEGKPKKDCDLFKGFSKYDK
jgi:hypothetical protein